MYILINKVYMLGRGGELGTGTGQKYSLICFIFFHFKF